ncbi:MAG: alpha/beta fold hydrolase [Candidatus Hodarchaeales archaeon]|jgi:pimeloyl-ACP methyl ester carboxylesterase
MTVGTIREIIQVGNTDIAVIKRMSDNNLTPTIVFVHGFGSSKEYFKHAFSSASLDGYSLIALDLVGFGQSSTDNSFSYSMRDHSRIVIKTLDLMKIQSFHLCTHSMGGLVGIEIAERFPNRIETFLNLEGNLSLEDCFMTGKVIESSYKDFNEINRKVFEENLRKEADTDPTLHSYLETFKQASSIALYRSARHTVRDSADPRLIDRFIALHNRCYIYGEKNKNIFAVEKKLIDAGVSVLYVDHAGHSMAEENPFHLYTLVRDFIDS